MGTFRKTGGEAVTAGTYWNFETGKKVKIAQEGHLPGSRSQSYYQAPPMLILAVAAVAAHLFLYELPKQLVPLYAAYAADLVKAYVVFDYFIIGAALTGLFVAGFGDLLRGEVKIPTFDWIPGRSYISSPHDDDKKTDKKSSDKK